MLWCKCIFSNWSFDQGRYDDMKTSIKIILGGKLSVKVVSKGGGGRLKRSLGAEGLFNHRTRLFMVNKRVQT